MAHANEEVDPMERDLIAALAAQDGPDRTHEEREEARAYVDAVFRESVRQIQVASLERRLSTETDPALIRRIARQIDEIRALPMAS